MSFATLQNNMQTLKAHRFTLLLILAILLGSLTGFLFGPLANKLKPLGDLFINLIFTAVVPLVFFSIASAVAEIREESFLAKIFGSMLLSFIFTSFIAACFMLFVVKLFPLAQHLILPDKAIVAASSSSLASQLVGMITVPDFLKLFTRDNMLALILFSILIGLATNKTGDKGLPVTRLLLSARDVSMQLINIIMLLAPLGFFAYFANLVGQIGPQLLTAYAQVTLVYYSASVVYFFVFLSLFAYLAGKIQTVKTFWEFIFLPASTAFATCSSAASIPANLVAAENMGVSKSIAELTIPLGGLIHKDGSVLGGVVKIAFLFGLFHLPFTGVVTLGAAILVGMLVGTVMGAIPSGGMIGEMLILSIYGFPPQSLIVIAVISMIIDPMATMISVTSNTACALLVSKWRGVDSP